MFGVCVLQTRFPPAGRETLRGAGVIQKQTHVAAQNESLLCLQGRSQMAAGSDPNAPLAIAQRSCLLPTLVFVWKLLS